MIHFKGDKKIQQPTIARDMMPGQSGVLVYFPMRVAICTKDDSGHRRVFFVSHENLVFVGNEVLGCAEVRLCDFILTEKPSEPPHA